MNRTDLRRAIGNSALLIATRIGTKMATTLLMIFIARKLGEQDFGVLSSLLAIVALFSIVAEFGLTVPLIRKIARDSANAGEALGKVISVKIPLGLIGCLLLLISETAFRFSFTITLLYGLSMFFEMQSLSVARSFEGFEQMKYEAAINVVERLFFLIAGCTVLFAGGGLLGLGVVYVCTNLLSLSLGLYLFTKHFSRVKLGFVSGESVVLLREAFPFFVAGLFSVLYNRADIYTLTLYRSAGEVGWYNAAFRIIEAQMFIPMAIVGSVFPLLSRYYNSSRQEFHLLHLRSLHFLLALGAGIALVTFAFAHGIIVFLYSEHYHQATDILKILSLMLPFFFVNFLLGNALIAAGKEQFSTATIGGGAVLNILLNLLLVHKYGAPGVAFARVGTEIFSCGIQFCFLYFMVSRHADLRAMTLIQRGEKA